MKLEIDISNKAELKSLRSQLDRYLKIVDFALKEGHSSSEETLDEMLPLNGKAVAPNEGVSTVLGLIESLPSIFSSSAIYEKTKDQISRGTVKAALQEAISKGKIIETQKGIGRRPSKYKKL